MNAMAETARNHFEPIKALPCLFAQCLKVAFEGGLEPDTALGFASCCMSLSTTILLMFFFVLFCFLFVCLFYILHLRLVHKALIMQ